MVKKKKKKEKKPKASDWNLYVLGSTTNPLLILLKGTRVACGVGWAVVMSSGVCLWNKGWLGYGQSTTLEAPAEGPGGRAQVGRASDTGTSPREQDINCCSTNRKEDILDHILMCFLSTLLFQILNKRSASILFHEYVFLTYLCLSLSHIWSLLFVCCCP